MSAATGEQSFSAQQRLKSYLCSTMTEKRYNNFLAIHVHKDTTLAIEFSQQNAKHFHQLGKFILLGALDL